MPEISRREVLIRLRKIKTNNAEVPEFNADMSTYELRAIYATVKALEKDTPSTNIQILSETFLRNFQEPDSTREEITASGGKLLEEIKNSPLKAALDEKVGKFTENLKVVLEGKKSSIMGETEKMGAKVLETINSQNLGEVDGYAKSLSILFAEMTNMLTMTMTTAVIPAVMQTLEETLVSIEIKVPSETKVSSETKVPSESAPPSDQLVDEPVD